MPSFSPLNKQRNGEITTRLTFHFVAVKKNNRCQISIHYQNQWKLASIVNSFDDIRLKTKSGRILWLT